jgi:hypothetical protein
MDPPLPIGIRNTLPFPTSDFTPITKLKRQKEGVAPALQICPFTDFAGGSVSK